MIIFELGRLPQATDKASLSVAHVGLILAGGCMAGVSIGL